MAEQILKIKLVADSNGVLTEVNKSIKLIEDQFKIVDSSANKVKALNFFELEKAKLLEQQTAIYKRLEASVDKINTSLQTTNLNAALGMNALAASANKANRELEAVQKKLKDVQLSGSFATSLGIQSAKITAPVSSSASGIGASLGIAVPKLQEDLKKTADIFATQLGIAVKNASSQLPVNQAAAIKQGFSFTSGATNVKTEIEKTTKASEDLNKSLTGQLSVWNRLKNGLAGIIVEYRLINSIYNAIGNFLTNIPAAGIRQQQAEASVTAIFGTAEGGRNLQFLKTLADEAGQSILSLQNAYTRFAPSAVLAGAKQSEVNQVFRDFTEVGTVLHFSEQQLTSLYLALEQMYGKTTVQSEEIKKQLGNVLPGAVEIGAKAWAKLQGVQETSVASFMDAMKKNQVEAKKFIPVFAQLYREIFGGENDAVFEDVRTKFASNLQRMKNQYEFFAQDMFKVTENVLNNTVRFAGDSLKVVRENLQGILQITEILVTLMGVRLAAAFGSFILGTKEIKSTADGAVKVVSNLTVVADKFKAFGNTIKSSLGVGAGAGLTSWLLGATTAVTGLALATTDLEIKYTKFVGTSEEVIKNLQKAYAEGNQAAGEELEKIAQLQEQSNSLLLEFEGTQIELSTVVRKLWDDFLKSNREDWEAIKGFGSAVWDTLTERVNNFAKNAKDALNEIKNFLINLVSTLNGVGAGIGSLVFDVRSGDFSGAVERAVQAYEETEKTNREKFKATAAEAAANVKANLTVVGDNISGVVGKAGEVTKDALIGYRDRVGEPITKFLRETAQLQNKINEEKRKGIKITPSNIGEESVTGKPSADKAGKGGAASLADSYQAAMNDIKANLEELRGDVQDKLAVINDQFKNNAISISDFFAQRKELLAEDIRLQKESLNEQIKVAFAQKDASKVADLGRQLKKLNNLESKEELKLVQDQITAYREYSDVLNNINVEYLKATGNLKEAALLEFDQRNQDIIRKLKVEDNTEALAKVAISRQMAGLSAEQEKYTRDITIELDKQQDALERVNVLKNIGALSELGAAKQIRDINEEIIRQKEALIAKDQETLEATPKNLAQYKELEEKIRKARAELENFKLTADTVAQVFENMVGGAFTNAFEGFATGTMNARQAWQSFLADIIKGIAKLAAEEARSALIGGLFKMGLSWISSSLGGGFEGKGPLMSYQNPFANGGVASGLSSVSGTVLTKPTMFPNAKVIPFASGGVLAGEAGAEAVLPLKRGKGGKLGVAMEGSVAGGNVININVSVDRSQGEDNSAYAARIAEVIAKRVAKEEIANAARPGNINNRVTKFG